LEAANPDACEKTGLFLKNPKPEKNRWFGLVLLENRHLAYGISM
jgi:hypothetical protein